MITSKAKYFKKKYTISFKIRYTFCKLCEITMNSFDYRISEKEFLRATLHYRRLGNLLSIDYLENRRQEVVSKIKVLVEDAKKDGYSSSSGLVLTVKESS